MSNEFTSVKTDPKLLEMLAKATVPERRQHARFIEQQIGKSQFNAEDREDIKGFDPVRTALKTQRTPLFPMLGAGFEFALDTWRAIAAAGPDEVARVHTDALAHRQEAIRRAVVCRFDDRADEAEGWAGIASFLTKTCRLPALET